MKAESSVEMSKGGREDIKQELKSDRCNKNKVRYKRRKHFLVFVQFMIEVVIRHCQLAQLLFVNQLTRFSQITAVACYPVCLRSSVGGR